MPSTGSAPSSERAQQTRARLLAAGGAAFGRKGFAAANLKRDILEPAKTSVGSFYHQFKDKGELLQALLESHSESLRARLSEIHHPGPQRSSEQVARESYELLFDLVDQEPDLMRIRMRGEGSDPEITDFFRRDQENWTRDLTRDYERIVEAYDLDIDPALAAELIGMLAQGAIRHYLSIALPDRPAARERLLGGLVRLTLHGLPGLTQL
jgi:AcrR family transcriptional regulator